MNIQDIRLDIDKKTGVAQWVTIGQGDKGGTTIRATVFDNDVAAALTGMSARFEMRMPNATYFEDTNCTIDGNVITYVVDESHAALYAGGESVAYFALYDGETAIYSTERFHVRVAKAASDGANPGHAWTNGIEEWLDEASDELDDTVADANSRVGATINAANAAVEGMRSDVDGAIDDTEEVIGRAEDAIDAMGDISELAVPEMSADVRGGAKLEEHGGLALRDGALGIGSLVQQSDGYARGGLAEVAAKGHAEQVSTTGKNLWKPTITSSKGLTFTLDADGAIHVNGTSNASYASNQYSIASDILSELKGSTVSLSCPEATSEAYAQINCYYNNSNHLTLLVDATTKTVTIPSQTETLYYAISVPTSGTTIDKSFHVQLELGSTATAYEPYTGGAPSPSPDYPQEIQVVRGRNLIDSSGYIGTQNGITFTMNSDGSITCNGTASATTNRTVRISVPEDGTYTLSGCPQGGGASSYQIWIANSSGSSTGIEDRGSGSSGTLQSSGLYDVKLRIASGYTCNNLIFYPQLVKGSTPQPYVPYGHVGMEARDPDTDELISCTALPLPSRGWVAGLPDGTADSLRMDGAGKCEWELKDEEVVLDGSSDESWAVEGAYASTGGGYYRYLNAKYVAKATSTFNNPKSMCEEASYVNLGVNTNSVGKIGFMETDGSSTFRFRLYEENAQNINGFRSYLSEHSITCLFALATPVTEDCGYVDMPAIPSDATVTIPELDALGIKYFVDDTVTQYGREIYARVRSEYADRLTALEAAVADLVTGA